MIELPPGKYFMVMWNIARQFGGMTSMCMARARNFLAYAGVDAPIVSFSLTGHYRELRQSLVDRGYLLADNRILNVFEYYRDADLSTRPEVKAPDWHDREPGAAAVRHEQILDQEGRLFAEVYRDDKDVIVHRRCFRADGSPFLVDHSDPVANSSRWKRRLWLLDQRQRCVATFDGAGQFYHSWMDELVGSDRATFIFDDKSAAKILRRYHRPNVLMITPIHSNHIKSAGDPARGVIDPNRAEIFNEPWRWDALVFLTASQRRDYVARFGDASNLPVVANPVRQPSPDVPAPQRDPRRGVIVGRLATSKNLPAAIEAFRLARESLPNLTLDIYGEGDQRPHLERLIATAGLTQAVQLRGHVTGAATEFASAGFSLITSRFEGFAMSALESLSHGCPVIAFDLRYGPPDLLGADEAGFVVPVNDIRAMADRIVAVCTDRELAERMSRRGRERAQDYSPEAITSQWSELISRLWQHRNTEHLITSVRCFATAHRADAGRVIVDLAVDWDLLQGAVSHAEIDARLRIVPDRAGPAVTQDFTIDKLTADHLDASLELDPNATLAGVDGAANSRARVEVVGAIGRFPFRADVTLATRTRWDAKAEDGRLVIAATDVDG